MEIKLIIISLFSGAVLGSIAGYIGGVIGGGISGYFDPLTRIVDFDTGARFKLAKTGAAGAKGLGAVAGFTVGALTSILGDALPIFALFLIVGVLFWFVGGWFVRIIGETIVGLPGGIVGGAFLGVIGGYAGRVAAEYILGLL